MGNRICTLLMVYKWQGFRSLEVLVRDGMATLMTLLMTLRGPFNKLGHISYYQKRKNHFLFSSIYFERNICRPSSFFSYFSFIKFSLAISLIYLYFLLQNHLSFSQLLFMFSFSPLLLYYANVNSSFLLLFLFLFCYKDLNKKKKQLKKNP